MTGGILQVPQRAAFPALNVRKREPWHPPYRPPIATQGMIRWLAAAAKEARQTAERKQVHIAAAMDRDQSLIARFEKGRAWPRDVDRILAAYADDLEIDVLDLWERALALARDDAVDRAAKEAIRAAEDAGKPQPSAETPREPARAKR